MLATQCFHDVIYHHVLTYSRAAPGRISSQLVSRIEDNMQSLLMVTCCVSLWLFGISVVSLLLFVLAWSLCGHFYDSLK